MADITTVNPYTGENIKTYDYMSESDIEKIINNSHEAFLEWRITSLEERSKVINSIGESLMRHKEELARTMTKERGKTYAQSLQEVNICKSICDFTASTGPKHLADDVRDIEGMDRGIVTYQPIGIIYGIQPWNYPAYQVIRYAIANLMAGNAILLKHASNVTGSGLLLEKILHDSDLPKALFRTLIISHEQSEEVIYNDKVRGVTLTGSDKAGATVAQQAAMVLKKTVMELGSNDAFLVLEDADIDLAVKTSAYARLYNNGETCVAAKRFVVVDSVYDEFREKLVKEFESYTMGDPMDESTKLGPLSMRKQVQAIEKQVAESVEKGAKKTVCGKVPEGTNGNFYPPVLLEDVKPGMPAYDDELFGPAVALIRAKDTDDALRIANDSRYGLGGGIFSKDENKAIELAKKYFDTGMVNINGYGLVNPELPFGGVKNSGYGREHGGSGMKEFVNEKSLFVINKAPI